MELDSSANLLQRDKKGKGSLLPLKAPLAPPLSSAYLILFVWLHSIVMTLGCFILHVPWWRLGLPLKVKTRKVGMWSEARISRDWRKSGEIRLHRQFSRLFIYMVLLHSLRRTQKPNQTKTKTKKIGPRELQSPWEFIFLGKLSSSSF